MCRNIKPLFNFDPPATEAELRAAATQYVKKISGYNEPSQANFKSYNQAIKDITQASQLLMASLTTNAPLKNRDIEAEKAKAKSALRFGK